MSEVKESIESIFSPHGHKLFYLANCNASRFNARLTEEVGSGRWTLNIFILIMDYITMYNVNEVTHSDSELSSYLIII